MMLKPDVALRHNAIWAGLLRRCAQSSTCSHAALLSAQRCRCHIVSERPLSRHETSWELWCHRVRPPPRLPPKRANERGNGSRNGRWEKRETALLVLTLTVFFLVCEQQSTKLRHWYHATYNRYLGRSDGRRGQSDWPMRKKGESRVREMRKRKYWISCLGGYEGCHHVHKHAFIINCTWLLCFSSPVRASKNDLSLFPLFIFVKPSRLRQIPVGVIFMSTVLPFGFSTSQEVKDLTEKTHHSPPLKLRPDSNLSCQGLFVFVNSASSTFVSNLNPFYYFLRRQTYMEKHLNMSLLKASFTSVLHAFLEYGDRILWHPAWCHEISQSPDTVRHQLRGCGYDKSLVQML